uniref:Transmembrane protein 230 n=1 Tax=Neobodo designis TaxID=312471 RepID=A0A7S1WAB2_NEODS|mmetsp:Transcript_90/g.317  ORF Transcript_90/g.317 Transcript_90/m.317 type:complete len:138 (+) Transcript_90:26-439(+)|eukprot:CAMPEP_0174850338 /NCGR_PEP_ID=MMETSP1114-20130205/19176_1 /TAXON_ID=312471 /ORGANISM="Neobodo designis, Strain CCAP 1951/1" /LENGTH=137 /DNA_ID=CAMNT_0016084793 /DNA_START=24 /DNA_END=437 /DNA_ORIENTATION=-
MASLYEEDSDQADVLEDRRRMGSSAVVDTGAEGASRPGALFRWLNPRDPHRARRRFGRLYWNAWYPLAMAILLTLFGVTFLLIGVGCMKECVEFERGIAFFVIGLLLFMPGMYGGVTLFYYLRGYRGYSYKDLPDMR